MKIAITYIVTNDYIPLFNEFYSSFNENFDVGNEKHFFVFTNKPELFGQKSNVTPIKINNDDIETCKFKKFAYIIEGEELLKGFDYILFMNSNQRCINKTSIDEMFNGKDMYTCTHPVDFDKKNSLCKNPKSKQFVPVNKFKDYFQAGNIGAKTELFLSMQHTIEDWRISDFLTGNKIYVPWHDESYYNKYMNIVQDLKNVSILKNNYNAPRIKPFNAQIYPELKIVMEDKQSFWKQVNSNVNDIKQQNQTQTQTQTQQTSTESNHLDKNKKEFTLEEIMKMPLWKRRKYLK